MDISNVSTAVNALNQSLLPQGIGIALTKKTLDANNQNSQSLINMMDNLNPNLGKNLDIRV